MEASKIIDILEDFYEFDKSSIDFTKKIWEIDCSKLNQFNVEIYDYLSEHPKEIKHFLDILKKDRDMDNFEFMLKNIPKSEEKKINKIKISDINRLLFIRGTVISRTKVFPQIKSAKFECPACGAAILINQIDTMFKEPTRCSCGRKGHFTLVSKEFEDCLMLVLEELPERLRGSEQPQSIRIKIDNQLCKREHEIQLGERIEIIGYLDTLQKIAHGQKTVYEDYVLQVLNFQNLSFIDFDTSVSDDEKKLFDEIKKQKDPGKFIAGLIWSDIHGYKKAKAALVYQQFGSTKWNGKRDFIHILLYGKPGTSKTDLAMRSCDLNPIARFSTATNISGVGLTASVKKDELTGNFVAVGGLLARCDGGLAAIDELEKMQEDDKKSLHTPMESGKLTVDKAGICANLVANAAIVATANEKVAEKPLNVVDNLDLPSAIKDRFDLIFEFLDIPNSQKDKKIAEKITERATFFESDTTFYGNHTTFLWNDTTFHILTLRKYIYLAKQITPKLSRRVSPSIHKWYIGLRQLSTSIGYESKKPTPRVVESVLRFARAIARSKMKDTVTICEVKLAIEFFDFIFDVKGNKPPEVIDVE